MTGGPDEFTRMSQKEARRRWRRRIVLVGLVVALLGGGTWVTTSALRICGSVGSGVYRVDGECVGVTDGSYVFRPELAGIEARIATENSRVRAEAASYVTIALLDPLTASGQDELLPGEVTARLEGAYAALRRVNTTTVVGDTQPQIQLVLASEGSTDPQWQRVTDQLVGMTTREHPLVAVIGLGTSTRQTQQRATKLSRAGIPMVSAYLGSDLLDYRHIPGLIKAAPSNRYYIDALNSYVDTHGITSAILVKDSNSDLGVDLFSQALKDNFTAKMGNLTRDFPIQVFTGTVGNQSGAATHLFSSIRANICGAAANGLQAILYAGREVDLKTFIDSLRYRPCLGAKLTILTAGLDLTGLLEGPTEQELRQANLTVVVAATVDAEGWQRNVPGTPEHYQDLLVAFQQDGFDPADLDGANAIETHDALLTATQAVRLAAPKGSGSNPSAATVRTQLLNLNGQFAVPAAGGTLSYSDHPPDTGEPLGKPIPVLQYPPPPLGPSRQIGPLYCLQTPLTPAGGCAHPAGAG